MSKIPRYNALILEELARIVNQEVELRGALITITYVECSADLKYAKVGFSVLPDNLVGSALRKLNLSLKQLLPILKTRLKLRRLPHLIWEFDNSGKEANKIEHLLADLNQPNR